MKKLIAVLLMAAMLVCLCSCGVSTEDKYNNAAADVKAGKYDKAIEAFEALNGYQDSDKYIMYAKCLKAGDGGEYEAAIKSLQTLGDFKEASMYIKYYTALSYEAEQEYEDAQDVYEEILMFKDVLERSKQIPDKILDRDLAEAFLGIDYGYLGGVEQLECLLNKHYSTSDTLMFEKVMDYAKSKSDAKDYATAAKVYDYIVNAGYGKAENSYKEAVYLLVEQRIGQGEYSNAKGLIKKFIPEYQNTDVLLNECDYQLTLQKVSNNGSAAAQEAYDAFKALGSYKDSAERAKAYEDAYADAAALRSKGDFDAAVQAFAALGTYSDASVQITETKYQAAVALMNDGKYEEAITAFKALNDYSDSKNQITACENAILEQKYQAAVALMNEGKYEEAITAFKALNGYSDSKNQMYQAAAALMNDGKYEEAISAFKVLNEYSDSADQILECQYRKAKELLENGNYAETYAIFISIEGYKDVDSLLVNDVNLSAAAREAKWQVGNYVTFGTYPQTKSGNDTTPIEWLVLARDGDNALVISRYALDCIQYNTKDTSVTWETCSLRTWLNNDFYNKAFSAEEKASIVLSKVTADKNPKYSTNPGNDTNDNVFLLSIPEVNNYFKDDASRMCAPTDYTVKNGANTSSSYKVDSRASCWWWLRSPGTYSNCASNVHNDGFVYSRGYSVNYSYCSVRPCVWVRLF